ncbi:MAG TPA: hypothetical protein VGN22_19590, partial [Pseudonocardia sp.]
MRRGSATTCARSATSACKSSSSGLRAIPGLCHHQDLRVDHVERQGHCAADEPGAFTERRESP